MPKVSPFTIITSVVNYVNDFSFNSVTFHSRHM